MVAFLVERLIRKLEVELGQKLEHVRAIYRSSGTALFKIGLFLPLTAHRGTLTKEVVHVARIASTRQEDCGQCLQMAITAAIKDGVDPAIVRIAAENESFRLPYDLQTVFDLVEASSRSNADDSESRARCSELLGETGMVHLALAASTAKVFPNIKRILGEGSCQRSFNYEMPRRESIDSTAKLSPGPEANAGTSEVIR